MHEQEASDTGPDLERNVKDQDLLLDSCGTVSCFQSGSCFNRIVPVTTFMPRPGSGRGPKQAVKAPHCTKHSSGSGCERTICSHGVTAARDMLVDSQGDLPAHTGWGLPASALCGRRVPAGVIMLLDSLNGESPLFKATAMQLLQISKPT